MKRTVGVKERNLTQQALAEKIRCSVIQIRRYEAGSSQPTLDVIRRLALALHVSADVIVFDENERDLDEELLTFFEAIKTFSHKKKNVIKDLLEAFIMKQEVKKWSS